LKMRRGGGGSPCNKVRREGRHLFSKKLNFS
jgi:hypothetical protein